jgi:hypothetical protein
MKSSKRKKIILSGIKSYDEQCSASIYNVYSSIRYRHAGFRPENLTQSQDFWIINFIEKIKNISETKTNEDVRHEIYLLAKKVLDEKKYISATDILLIFADKGILKATIWRVVKILYKHIEPDSEKDFSLKIIVEDQHGAVKYIKSSGFDKFKTILSSMRSFFHYDIIITDYKYYRSSENDNIPGGRFHLKAEFEGKSYFDDSFGEEDFKLFVQSYINIVNLITVKYKFVCTS